jgi:hypothetical protein
MDHIETILRGRPQTGPDHQHWGGPGPGGKGVIGSAMLMGDACLGKLSGRQYAKLYRT